MTWPSAVFWSVVVASVATVLIFVPGAAAATCWAVVILAIIFLLGMG